MKRGKGKVFLSWIDVKSCQDRAPVLGFAVRPSLLYVNHTKKPLIEIKDWWDSSLFSTMGIRGRITDFITI